MKAIRFLAIGPCLALVTALAFAVPHECKYSSVDPRLDNAKLQADFDVHRATIESRVALEQLRVAEKVAFRLHKHRLLSEDEYGERLKEINAQQHVVRVHMLKSKIAAFESVLGVSSNDTESLNKLRKLRDDLQAEERLSPSASCSGGTGKALAD